MRTAIFNCHGQDSDLTQYDGQEVIVRGEIPSDQYDARDVGPMYNVEFSDGLFVGVFRDELTGDTIPTFSQYYTSGAAGVTKDPTPYIVVSPLDNMPYRVTSEATVPVESCDFEPRPWFDNHNPIIQAFRLRKPDPQNGMDSILADTLAALDTYGVTEFQRIIDRDGIDATVEPGHIRHARRVLAKRQALA